MKRALPIILIPLTFILMSAFALEKSTHSTNDKYNNTSPAGYDIVLIKKVTLTDFPSRKSDGKKWDNASAFFLPDVYLKIIDTKNDRTIFSNPNSRRENVELGETVSFSINESLTNLTHSYKITFYDYDSMTGHDVGWVNYILS